MSISTRGYHPNISAMHHSMALKEELREEQERMKKVTHIFPKPPAGHPWHEAKAEAVRLGSEFQAIAKVSPNGDPKKNQAFNLFYAADKVADQLWGEWKTEYRAKLTTIREHMGEEAWPAFWAALPDGDAMAPVVEAALAKIGAAQ